MAITKQKMNNTADDFEESFTEFADETPGAAKTAVAEGREVAENVGAKASGVAATTTEKLKEAASYVGDKAEQATEAVGVGLESLGGAIRDHTPDKGVVGNASAAVADKLEGAGHYLEEQGLTGIGKDVTNLIRNNPIPALLIGVGVGFLLARMVRK